MPASTKFPHGARDEYRDRAPEVPPARERPCARVEGPPRAPEVNPAIRLDPTRENIDTAVNDLVAAAALVERVSLGLGEMRPGTQAGRDELENAEKELEAARSRLSAMLDEIGG